MVLLSTPLMSTVLQRIDWIIITVYFAVILMVGVIVSKRASKSSAEYFLGGRRMPWWLLGISMVATTFSTDTPLLVTDIVRSKGVSGNWIWWAFLLTGMLTVFIYAKLWRRSKVFTDVEFYELRYSGKEAAFLRGFRAVYLGVFFNIMIMATVSLAVIKIGGILFGFSPLKSVSIAMIVTVIYCGLGGFESVLITDFILFGFAMFGAVMAAIVACSQPEVGGLTGLLSHPNVAEKLSMIPITKSEDEIRFADTFVGVMVIPLAVQWWSAWYPGAEPGGGGYLAQRMLSAKDERNAMSATLVFNACHYALRPWPWIIVALASLIVYPDLASIKEAFPNIEPKYLKNDVAYPVMLTFLKPGMMGIVMASLIAAYMSTMSTHLNWGSSYIVNDFYKRFMEPNASEKKLVLIGRLSTIILMLLTAICALLLLKNALQAFQIILQIGAGTGLIFILRWFWWRVNAWSEITAMVVSFLFALYIKIFHPLLDFPEVSAHMSLLMGVGITTVAWLVVTFLTRTTNAGVLRNFYRLVRPGGAGWNKVLKDAADAGEPIEDTATTGDLPRGILCMILGCVAVYSAVFASGYYLYGQITAGVICTVLAVAGVIGIVKLWPKLEMK